jgi:hypothetical protein
MVWPTSFLPAKQSRPVGTGSRSKRDRAYALHAAAALMAAALNWVDVLERRGSMSPGEAQGWMTFVGMMLGAAVLIAIPTGMASSIARPKDWWLAALSLLLVLMGVVLISEDWWRGSQVLLSYLTYAYVAAAVLLSLRWFFFARKRFV